MPFVFISRNREKVPDEMLQRVIKALPKLVAVNLTVKDNPAAQIVPGDVEIKVLESLFDTRTKDLEIIVYAGQFKERLVNLELRCEKIATGIHVLLQQIYPTIEITGFTWVLLAPQAYSEF